MENSSNALLRKVTYLQLFGITFMVSFAIMGFFTSAALLVNAILGIPLLLFIDVSIIGLSTLSDLSITLGFFLFKIVIISLCLGIVFFLDAIRRINKANDDNEFYSHLAERWASLIFISVVILSFPTLGMMDGGYAFIFFVFINIILWLLWHASIHKMLYVYFDAIVNKRRNISYFINHLLLLFIIFLVSVILELQFIDKTSDRTTYSASVNSISSLCLDIEDEAEKINCLTVYAERHKSVEACKVAIRIHEDGNTETWDRIRYCYEMIALDSLDPKLCSLLRCNGGGNSPHCQSGCIANTTMKKAIVYGSSHYCNELTQNKAQCVAGSSFYLKRPDDCDKLSDSDAQWCHKYYAMLEECVNGYLISRSRATDICLKQMKLYYK